MGGGPFDPHPLGRWRVKWSQKIGVVFAWLIEAQNKQKL